jgi:putative flippase GtrA
MKLIKFCIVGVANTLITLYCFYFFNKVLHIGYITSTITAYMIGMLNSYSLNKKWTFHDNDEKLFAQLSKFVLTNIISLGINVSIMYILVDIFTIDSMVSQIIATGFSTVSNYLGSKYFVFLHSKKSIA